MPAYQVVATYKMVAELPAPHLHLAAIGVTGEKDSGPRAPWQVEDILLVKDSATFATGPLEMAAPVEVSVVLCVTCGQRVLQISPSTVEQRLPSYSV